VLRAVIEVRQQFSSLLRNNRCFVIFTGKFMHCVDGVKRHDRDEFNFMIEIVAQYLNAFETVDTPS